MTWSYGQLIDLCTLGERLGFFRQAFPSKPDGILGIHILNESWRFIPATEIEADPQLKTLVQANRCRLTRWVLGKAAELLAPLDPSRAWDILFKPSRPDTAKVKT